MNDNDPPKDYRKSIKIFFYSPAPAVLIANAIPPKLGIPSKESLPAVPNRRT